MRRGVSDLDLRLVGGDLVDDVAIGCGQRLHDTVPALVGVGRIAVFGEALAQHLRRPGEVLLGRSNLVAERRDQAIAQIGALQHLGELLVHGAVERSDRVHPEQRDGKDQQDQQGHAADDAAAKAAQRLHWPPASRTAPS
jgi:hypothetical protein